MISQTEYIDLVKRLALYSDVNFTGGATQLVKNAKDNLYDAERLKWPVEAIEALFKGVLHPPKFDYSITFEEAVKRLDCNEERLRNSMRMPHKIEVEDAELPD